MIINTFRLKFSIFLNTMLNTSQPRILAQFAIFSLLFKIISNEINTLLNTFQPEIVIFFNTLSLNPKKVCVYKKKISVYRPLGVKTQKNFWVLFISLGDTSETNLKNFGDVVV